MSRASIVVLLVVASFCLADTGPEKKKRPEVPTTPEARQKAIRAGLAYLDEHLFGLPECEGTPREPFTYAIAGIAHLLAEDGQRATRPAGGTDAVRRIQKRLENYISDVERKLRDPNNLPSRHGLMESSKLIQYTWPLGAAGLFFSEMRLRGIHADEAARALVRIEAILADCQEANGGWGHGKTGGKEDPRTEAMIPEEFRKVMKAGGGYPSTLLSSTNCVAPALGVMKTRWGIPTKTLERAREYYRAAQLDNGNFPYDPSQRSAGMDTTGAPRAAGAIFALLCMGVPENDPVLSKACEYVAGQMEHLSEGHGSATYGLLMGALACRALGDREWKAFDGMYAPRILGAQDKDGAFGCVCEGKSFGTSCDEEHLMQVSFFADGQKAYLTAIQTLILLLDRTPPRLLPTPSKSVRTR